MAAGSTYNVIALVGASKKSWEEAAKNAVEAAAKTVKDLRVAEIVKLDLKYIDSWTIWLDVKIILKTIIMVLKRSDAY